MGIQNDLLGNPGVTAASAIYEYRLLESATFPTVQHTSADTDKPMGVALADAATGEAVQYAKLDGGIYTVVADDAISKHANIVPSTAGRVKTAATGDFIIGYALEAATAQDDNIRCVLFHGETSA